MKQSKMARGNGEVKNKTEHERKTKVQLIGELAEMRQRIVELEAHAKQIEPVLAEHEQIYPVMDESTREFIAISNQLKHNLAERVKELRCLYGIATIAEKSEITLDELYQEVANLLPSSWQYPEICCARITTEDKEFRTANYRDAKWRLCSDIKIGGVKAGAVEVNYLEKRPKLDEGPFSRDERWLIDAVATQLGRITERKRAEEELVRLSSAVKMSTDSIVIGNLDGKIIDVNEATLKMYGTDDERDLIGKNSFELIAPEELEKALAGAKEVLEKGYVTNREYHIITKDGGRVPVEMSVAIMKDADGKPIGSVGISRDITERKKAEEALKETNMRYKLLFEASEAGINLLDKYGNFLMVNKPASEPWGMSIENIVNKNIRDIMPPDMANEAMSLIHEIEKTGTGRKQERYLKHLDRYFIEDIQPVLDSEGKFFGVQVLTYDITERKKAEEKLTESENKFRTIFENIGDSYYRVDLKGNVTLANPAAVKIIGYDSIEEVIGKNLAEDFYYYPEARKIFMEELKKHGEVKNLEVTLKRKDGTLVIVEVNSHFVHDATGKPIEIEGIAHNITERKEAEKRLQESEEKLRVMFESITDGVIVTDLTGTVVEANDGAAHLVGYSNKEELIGRNAFEFVSPKDRALAMNATKKTLEGGLVQERTEYTILTADGEEINTDSSAAVLYDSSGNPTGIINVVRDITERKKAEEMLRESTERYRLLFESSEAGINLLDKYGNFLMVNKPASEPWGMSVENIVNKNIRDIMPPDMANEAMSLIHEIEETGTGRGQERYIKHLDKYFIEDVRPVLDSEGKFFGVQVLTYDITERKRVEEAMRASEERFKELADLLPQIVFETDETGNLTFVNRRALEAGSYGYTEEDIAKGWSALQMVAPQDQDRATQDMLRRLSGEELGAVEYTGLRKDGSEFSILIDANPSVRENKVVGLRGVVIDITERKKAEEEITLLSQALAMTATAVTLIDLDGKVMDVNEAMLRLHGFANKRSVLGKPVLDLVAPEQREAAAADMQDLWEKGEVNGEYEIITEDGKTIPVETSVTVMKNTDGKATGLVAITRDITERKKAEQELQERNAQLKAQREELVEKATELELVSQAKSEFLASMSHELRTPLNAVIGFSELMLDGIPGEINDEQRGCVNDILDSGRRLLSLINDILDLSKVEAGKIELKLQNLDIADIITGVVQIMKPVLGKNGQEIEVSVMQGLPKVRGDKNRLEQILLNLLSNASKFTDQGGRVRIHVGRKDDYCQVAVIDTGIGIKKEDQEHVFEAFVQGETLSDRKKEGTGLGLTLTKQFVEATGGRIWMESEYGKGSTFIFTIPLAGEPLETSLGDKQSSYS